jgi:hypothetical protein
MFDMTGINLLDRNDHHTSYAVLLSVYFSHNHAYAEILSVSPKFCLYHISIVFGRIRDIIALPELGITFYASWKDGMDSLVAMAHSLIETGQDFLAASSIAIAIDLVYRISDEESRLYAKTSEKPIDLLATDNGCCSIPEFLETYRFIGDFSYSDDDPHDDNLFVRILYHGDDSIMDDILPF